MRDFAEVPDVLPIQPKEGYTKVDYKQLIKNNNEIKDGEQDEES